MEESSFEVEDDLSAMDTSSSLGDSSAVSEDMFEVESIIDERVGPAGRKEYRVRWKDFGSDEDTWEPEDNLGNGCEALFDVYRRRMTAELVSSSKRSAAGGANEGSGTRGRGRGRGRGRTIRDRSATGDSNDDAEAVANEMGCTRGRGRGKGRPPRRQAAIKSQEEKKITVTKRPSSLSSSTASSRAARARKREQQRKLTKSEKAAVTTDEDEDEDSMENVQEKSGEDVEQATANQVADTGEEEDLLEHRDDKLVIDGHNDDRDDSHGDVDDDDDADGEIQRAQLDDARGASEDPVVKGAGDRQRRRSELVEKHDQDDSGGEEEEEDPAAIEARTSRELAKLVVPDRILDETEILLLDHNVILESSKGRRLTRAVLQQERRSASTELQVHQTTAEASAGDQQQTTSKKRGRKPRKAPEAGGGGKRASPSKKVVKEGVETSGEVTLNDTCAQQTLQADECVDAVPSSVCAVVAALASERVESRNQQENHQQQQQVTADHIGHVIESVVLQPGVALKHVNSGNTASTVPQLANPAADVVTPSPTTAARPLTDDARNNEPVKQPTALPGDIQSVNTVAGPVLSLASEPSHVNRPSTDASLPMAIDFALDLNFDLKNEMKMFQMQQGRMIAPPLFRRACLEGDAATVRLALLHFKGKKSPAPFKDDELDQQGMSLFARLCRLFCPGSHSHEDIMEYLVQFGADVNRVNPVTGQFPIHVAVEANSLCKVKKLISLKAAVNVCDSKGVTPLMRAATLSSRHQHGIILALLEAGADFNADCGITRAGVPLNAYRLAEESKQLQAMAVLKTHAERVLEKFDTALRQVLIDIRVKREMCPMHCYGLWESPEFHVYFPHQSCTLPTPRHGYVVVLAVTQFTGQQVNVRLWGPCPFTEASVNGIKLDSLQEHGQYVFLTSLQNGTNRLTVKVDHRANQSQMRLLCQVFLVQLNRPHA